MTLVELREKINLENLKMFVEFFLEKDEDIKYVVTNEDNEEDFSIIHREELVNSINNKKLKIEYVEHGEFSLAILDNKSVRIEYF